MLTTPRKVTQRRATHQRKLKHRQQGKKNDQREGERHLVSLSTRAAQ